MMRQARQLLDTEHGTRMSDADIVRALASAIIDGTTSESTGRARNQIAYTICSSCKRGTQDGAGIAVPIDAAAVEKALCNAQHIGSIDGAMPARATHEIPPRIARFIEARDGHRCATPGCRSARGLEIHHIVPRSRGGTHDPSNMTLRCSACHLAHHEGRLTISGTAPDKLVAIRTNDPCDFARRLENRESGPLDRDVATDTPATDVPDGSAGPTTPPRFEPSGTSPRGRQTGEPTVSHEGCSGTDSSSIFFAPCYRVPVTCSSNVEVARGR